MAGSRRPVYRAAYPAIWSPSAGRAAGGLVVGPASVVSITDSSDTTGSNHTVALPGTSIGQLLILLQASRANVAIGWPAGYTEFVGEGAASAVLDMAAAYRVADGLEGASITTTTSLSRSTATQVYLINNHNAALVPPEGGQASSSGYNPPGLDPSWDAAENPGAFGGTSGSNDLSATMAVQSADLLSTLWIAWAGWDSAAGTGATSAPTNYGDYAEIDDASGGHAAMCSAIRLLTSP